jgi:folate-binding protein YgfZ
MGLRKAGYDLFETLRIETGWPELGVDMDADTYPAEAGLEKAVSYTKGCYLGQETTTRLKTQGKPKDKMVGLRIDGTVTPGAAVVSEGQPAGKITSVSPWDFDGALALATVPFSLSSPGTRLKVLSDKTERPAEVVSLPFRRSS